MLQAYGISDKGRVRPTNEDCFAADEALRLCVVADGMGGHNAGEVAARIAVDAVVELVRDGADGWPFGVDPGLSDAGNLLRTAIYLANLRILETAIGAEEYEGMGTTIVAALVAGDRLSVGHVGDSRFYLFANGRLRQLTQDDSWVATMLAHDPDVDPNVLEQHPLRNALTNVVGTRSHTQVHIVEETLSGAELLLLTTDGVHGVLDDRRLEQLLGEGNELPQTAAAILDAALARGSRDNCTAIVARYLSDYST
jgi:serine/threonine protein phosphatase PrpC